MDNSHLPAADTTEAAWEVDVLQAPFKLTFQRTRVNYSEQMHCLDGTPDQILFLSFLYNRAPKFRSYFGESAVSHDKSNTWYDGESS